MVDSLKKLSPTHEPLAYLYVILVAWQLIFNHMPVPDNWVQYTVELLGTIGARQIVTPTAKDTKNELSN